MSVEPVALLLRAGVRGFADAMQVPAETTRAVLASHVDTYMADLQEAYAAVSTQRRPTRADFGDNWRTHWKELPLHEIWEGNF